MKAYINARAGNKIYIIFLLVLFIHPFIFLSPEIPLALENQALKENNAPEENYPTEEISSKDKKKFEALLKEVIGRSLYKKRKKISPHKLKIKGKKKPKKGIMRVYGTSFGKPGNKGESNYFKDGSRVRWGLVAVALPDPSAIGKWVEIRRIRSNGKKGRWHKMKVKDLGPWFRDDPYWRKKSKIPRAVYFYKQKKRRFDKRIVVNPAGIDITPWGWQRLGVSVKKSYNHSQHVEWRFLRR